MAKINDKTSFQDITATQSVITDEDRKIFDELVAERYDSLNLLDDNNLLDRPQGGGKSGGGGSGEGGGVITEKKTDLDTFEEWYEKNKNENSSQPVKKDGKWWILAAVAFGAYLIIKN